MGNKADFFQLGIVVADIDVATIHYGRLYGIDHFWRLDTNYQGRYRDWHGRFANKNAFAKLGPVYLELVQPVTGEGNAKQWLRERGEGIFHLGFAVDDMAPKSVDPPVVFESFGATLPNGGAAVIHLDTVAELGYYTEWTHRPLADQINTHIDAQLAALAAQNRR